MLDEGGSEVLEKERGHISPHPAPLGQRALTVAAGTWEFFGAWSFLGSLSGTDLSKGAQRRVRMG